jgi:hypothetical protein
LYNRLFLSSDRSEKESRRSILVVVGVHGV